MSGGHREAASAGRRPRPGVSSRVRVSGDRVVSRRIVVHMSGPVTPDVDALAYTARYGRTQEDRDAALSDLAARARERDEAYDRGYDRAAEEVTNKIEGRLARRVVELEAAFRCTTTTSATTAPTTDEMWGDLRLAGGGGWRVSRWEFVHTLVLGFMLGTLFGWALGWLS